MNSPYITIAALAVVMITITACAVAKETPSIGPTEIRFLDSAPYLSDYSPLEED